MSRFRSKAVEIDAFQWDGNDLRLEFWPIWAQEAFEVGKLSQMRSCLQFLWVKTPEGTMRASPGDWVIRGTEGELYPCKPSVFERKYEPV